MSYRDIKEYYYEDIMIRDDTHYYSHQDVKDTLDEIEEDVNNILSKLRDIRTIDDLTDIITAYEMVKELSKKLY